MKSLGEIEIITKEYAEERSKLAVRLSDLEDEIAAIKRKHLPGIKRAVERTAERKSILHASIAESPNLFGKPRTLIVHGVKIGFQKQKGTIEWEDAEFVVARLKKLFPDTYTDYLKITEKPDKKALAKLSVAELKKIGVTAEETGDAVLIKTADSEIDKLVNALLKEDEIDGAKEAA